MMTREQVEDLAKVAAEKMVYVRGLAGCNTFGLETSDSAALLGHYMMARDEALAAHVTYQKAMAEYLTQPAALTTAGSEPTELA